MAKNEEEGIPHITLYPLPRKETQKNHDLFKQAGCLDQFINLEQCMKQNFIAHPDSPNFVTLMSQEDVDESMLHAMKQCGGANKELVTCIEKAPKPGAVTEEKRS